MNHLTLIVANMVQAHFEDEPLLIPYRPSLAQAIGGVLPAILLQQIWFRWSYHELRPFYKFRSPCRHKLYREGDDWSTELGVSPAEFDTALKAIGTKITRGTSKSAVFADEVPHFDRNGVMKNRKHLVGYWTDSARVTWYTLNLSLFMQLLASVYNWEEWDESEALADSDKHQALGTSEETENLEDTNVEKLSNSDKPDYLGTSTTQKNLENVNSGNILSTKTTTKTSSNTTSKREGGDLVLPGMQNSSAKNLNMAFPPSLRIFYQDREQWYAVLDRYCRHPLAEIRRGHVGVIRRHMDDVLDICIEEGVPLAFLQLWDEWFHRAPVYVRNGKEYQFSFTTNRSIKHFLSEFLDSYKYWLKNTR